MTGVQTCALPIFIIEANEVGEQLPVRFQKALKELTVEGNALAQKQLDLEPGGIFPAGNQYGNTPIRINYFSLGTTSGSAETWNRTLGARGWNNVINNDTLDDVVIGIAGIQLPNASQRIVAHQWTIAGKEYPVIEHEAEILSYKNPIILYERGLLVPKKTRVKLDVLVQGAGGGNAVVKPYGFALVSPEILTKKVPK